MPITLTPPVYPVSYREKIFLKVFDKSGHAFTLFDAGDFFPFEKIHFPLTSVGLVESYSLYLFEETLEGLNTPKSLFPNAKWRIRFDNYVDSDIENDNFFIYTIDWEQDYPTIVKHRELILTMTDGSLSAVDTNGQLLTGKNNEPLQINIGFTSKEEASYTNFFFIEEIIDEDDLNAHLYDNDESYFKNDNSWCKMLVMFQLWGETRSEDERFKHLLDNLGLELKSEDWYLFKDAPLEDDNVDWNTINNKRKELLLEHSNIWPYIGSYKGLRNVINWLGWSELGVKEFWKNINDDKRSSLEIWNGDNKFWKTLNASNLWKKTGELQFVYPINKATGEIDEYGFPEVTEDMNFTVDEILFKLWGLKKFIQDQFLPLGTKIIDITGEGVYFEKYNIVNWSNKVKIWNSSRPIEQFADWITPGIIEDWSWKFKTWGLVDYTDLKLEDVYGDLIGDWKYDWMIDHYKITFPFKPLDNDNPIIGTPLFLRNLSFNFTWDEWVNTWDDNNYATWDDLQWGDFYEMEWIVEKNIPNAVSISSGRQHITEISEWETFLPYSGVWTVKLRMWNGANALFEKVFPDSITIRNHRIELSIISNYFKKIKTWDDLSETNWNQLNTSWNQFGLQMNSKLDNIRIPLNHLTMRSYIDNNYELLETNTYDLEYLNNRLGTAFMWDKFDDVVWDDLDSVTWDDFDMHAMSTPGFKITAWSTGGTIELRGKPDLFTFVGSTITDLLDELQTSTLDGFTQFEYSIVEPDVNPLTWYIQATAKYSSPDALYLIEFLNGMETNFTDPEHGNSYLYLPWDTWTGPENNPPTWCSLWRGYDEHLSIDDGWGNPKWNAILADQGIQEYENIIKYDLSHYMGDWINYEKTWLQSDTFNFKIGNPMILTHYGSLVPNLVVDSWEILIDSDRKVLTKNQHIVWLPLHKDDIVVNIKGKDGNNNSVEESYTLKHLS